MKASKKVYSCLKTLSKNKQSKPQKQLKNKFFSPKQKKSRLLAKPALTV